jgi:hypothetical protein
MSKNHYQMTAVGTAQLEIDYLRDQLNQARKQLKDVNHAKEVLKKDGYFVENLWHVEDVQGWALECDEETAQKVLKMALTNDATMEQVWFAIDDACEELGIEPKEK